jgi:hypothetical protein
MDYRVQSGLCADPLKRDAKRRQEFIAKARTSPLIP